MCGYCHPDELIRIFADLRAAIAELAAAGFAHIAGASSSRSPARVESRSAAKPASSGSSGRIRRSPEGFEKQAALILSYLKKNPLATGCAWVTPCDWGFPAGGETRLMLHSTRWALTQLAG